MMFDDYDIYALIKHNRMQKNIVSIILKIKKTTYLKIYYDLLTLFKGEK